MLRFVLAPFLVLSTLLPAQAQERRVVVPNFWDPKIRVERPEPGPARVVRFLTDDEYPPLHFAGPDGGLTGFSVELARAACEKLSWTCTVQARRFDTLADSLSEGRGDVIAAALTVTPALRQRFLASHLYFRTPARFLTVKGNEAGAIDASSLPGRRVAVIAGTAHAAFLDRLMPFVQRREAPNLAAALAMLRSGEVDYLFGDGVALSVVLAAETGREFAFAGGPYLESGYFGEGIALLMRKDEAALKRSLDYALQSLWDDGTYARLYLRFFPVGPF